MRIAFFTDTYHPSVDGVVRSIDLFKAGLEARGHQVRVFAPEGRAGFERRDGAHYAPSTVFPPYPQYRIPYHTGRLVEEAARWKPDIVHSHAMLLMGFAAQSAAKKCKAPLVGTFHTLLPSAMHYLTGHEGLQLWGADMSWHYLRWFYGGFDAVVSPSLFMQAELASRGIKSSVVASPVDVDKFRPGPVGAEVRRIFCAPNAPGRKMAERSRAENGSAILYLGRVAKEKNLDFLLAMARTRSFAELGAPLLIAGDGPYKDELGEKIRANGLAGQVRLLGRVDEKVLVQYYRAASAVILPSAFETQGLVALEAMACGTPVAAMRGTALEEIVLPKVNGALFFDNAVEAAERLRQI
ncbi:MAG: glycosyltransferase, partial [Candidatus Micrarchaeota archaeon]